MKTKTILFFVLLVLALFLNFLPKYGQEFPLHVDEWVHVQYSNHLSTGSPLYFGQAYSSLEVGYHYLLATLSLILGTDYFFIALIFPLLVTLLLCLGVFVLARKIWNENAGLFAILFVALLKSTVVILGPVFLVPMALGLFFLSLGLFLVHKKSDYWFVLFAYLLFMHPPTATAFFVLINLYFIFNRENYSRNIFLQVLAILIALPNILPRFLVKGISATQDLMFNPIIPLIDIPIYLGWLVTALVVLGIYISTNKKEYSIAIYSLGLFVFIFVFFKYNIDFFVPYARALMYLYVVFAVSFGIGCDWLISFVKNKKRRSLLAIFIILLVLFSALPSKIESGKYMYKIANSEDAEAFRWVKENTPKDSIALLDPWKANAFTPIAERVVYSRVVQGPNEFYEARNKEIYDFFKQGCKDLELLEANNISIVYGNCSGSDLKEAYPNVYLR